MIWFVLAALVGVFAVFMIFSLGWSYGFSSGQDKGFKDGLSQANAFLLRYRNAWTSRGLNIDDLR